MFIRNGDVWREQAKLEGVWSDNFGASVSLDGDTAIVGARDESGPFYEGSGAAYVFVRNGTQWSRQARLTGSTGYHENFGTSVSISGDRIVVGAAREDNDRGAVYVFDREGAVWTQSARISRYAERFGISVSVLGEHLVVGAWKRYVGDSPGSAYLYVKVRGDWYERSRLEPPESSLGDAFGYSVSVGEGMAVVGAMAEGSDGSGTTYLFDIPDDNLRPITSMVVLSSGSRRLKVDSVFRHRIGIEHTSDLSVGSWLDLGNFVDEGNGISEFIDPDPIRQSRSSGFYRPFLRPE